MTKTIIFKNCVAIAIADNETKAMKMLMDKLEKHPEYYSNVEYWFYKGPHNYKDIYTFKTVSDEIK